MALAGKLTFGSYEVSQNPDGSPRVLGQGSFGVTYMARHTMLGRITALKVIREDLLKHGSRRGEEETGRFLAEARAVGNLHHPGIAMVHDCALDNGVFYYAMEYCDGGSLKDWSARNGPMPWTEVRRIALQLASALECAHASGFLHRDIKPSNIMLHDKGASRQAKLIDFGLATRFAIDSDESSVTVRHERHKFRGNLATASPEQILEQPLDPRSDLFSLGITLWWLLLGKSPFAGCMRGPMIARRLDSSSYASLLPEALDPEARSLLEGLLEKDPEKRFASARDVIKHLTDAPRAAVPVSEPFASPPVGLQPLPQPPNLEDDYAVGGILATAAQAKLYSGVNLATHRVVIVIIPDASLETAARVGMRDAANRHLDFGAYAFLDWRTTDGDDVFVISKPEGCSLLNILRKLGPARFADALPLFGHLARCFDASRAWTTFGIRMNPGDILVRTRNGDSHIDRFRSWSDIDPDSLRCLPSFHTGADRAAASDSTLSTTAHEFPPLAQFAALIYHVLAGSAVCYAAFFTASGCMVVPGLSEDGNAMLADTISAPETQPSACGFVQGLATLEGQPITELAPLIAPPNARDFATGAPAPATRRDMVGEHARLAAAEEARRNQEEAKLRQAQAEEEARLKTMVRHPLGIDPQLAAQAPPRSKGKTIAIAAAIMMLASAICDLVIIQRRKYEEATRSKEYLRQVRAEYEKSEIRADEQRQKEADAKRKKLAEEQRLRDESPKGDGGL